MTPQWIAPPLLRRAVFGGAAVLLAWQLGLNSAAAGPYLQCGKASWYKLTGKTASGEQADPSGLTAAHRTLPFGTLVDVTNLANGRTVTVRINDRGPFAKGRVIDVTLAAAKQLDFVNKGVTRVGLSTKSAEISGKIGEFCP